MRGTNDKKPLRLRIPTDDEVNFKNVFMKKKEAEVQQQPVKKPKEEDIDRAIRRATQDHDKIGTGAADDSLVEIARGLVAAGDGSGFHGGNQLIGDVRELVPESSEDSDASEEEQPGSKDAAGKDPEKDAGKKVPVWFDRDRACNAAKKDCEQLFGLTKKQCQEEHDKLQKLINGIPAKHQAKYLGEERIGKTRLRAMSLLLAGDNGQLKDYINSFILGAADSRSPAKSDAASTSSNPHAGLGSAPPCQGFENMLIFDEWEAMIAPILECESAKDTKAKKQQFVSYKANYLTLKNALVKASNDIIKVNKDLVEEDAEKVVQAKGKANTGKQAPTTSGGHATALPSLFDHGAAIATSIVAHAEATMPLDGSTHVPVIVKSDATKHAAFMKDPIIMNNLGAMRKGFDEDPAKLTMVRAQQPLPSSMLDTCMARGEELFPGYRVAQHGEPCTVQLDEAKKPAQWVFLKNADHAAYEKDYLPTIRLLAHGSRQILCVNYMDVCDFMIGTGALGAAVPPSPVKAKNYFKSMAKDTLEAFVRSGFAIYTATLGPGEALYMPPMMIFAERSIGDDHLIGLRFTPTVLNAASLKHLQRGSAREKLIIYKESASCLFPALVRVHALAQPLCFVVFVFPRFEAHAGGRQGL